jgi:hypothetical protein
MCQYACDSASDTDGGDTMSPRGTETVALLGPATLIQDDASVGTE